MLFYTYVDLLFLSLSVLYPSLYHSCTFSQFVFTSFFKLSSKLYRFRPSQPQHSFNQLLHSSPNPSLSIFLPSLLSLSPWWLGRPSPGAREAAPRSVLCRVTSYFYLKSLSKSKQLLSIPLSLLSRSGFLFYLLPLMIFIFFFQL